MDGSPTVSVLLGHECWERLRAEEVGRLAVVVDDRPEIFPVNYVVDHGTIVFRTGLGSKLAAIIAGSPVAFEIDGEGGGEAFSVVIRGAAGEIGDRYELFEALDLPLYPWNAAPKHHFIRILPELVTGRRFRVEDRRIAHLGEQPPHHDPPD